MRNGAPLHFSHLGEPPVGQSFETALRNGQVCEIDLEFRMELLVIDFSLLALGFFQFVVVEVLAGLRGLLGDAALQGLHVGEAHWLPSVLSAHC